jgi:hypothetical protein
MRLWTEKLATPAENVENALANFAEAPHCE